MPRVPKRGHISHVRVPQPGKRTPIFGQHHPLGRRIVNAILDRGVLVSKQTKKAPLFRTRKTHVPQIGSAPKKTGKTFYSSASKLPPRPKRR